MKPRTLVESGIYLIVMGAAALFFSGTIRAQKPFSIQEHSGKSWLIRPNGERFFSLGVCKVDMGAQRDEFKADNPGYAAWQHYATSNRWADATVKRLRSWGFTTIGAWSDFRTLRESTDTNLVFAPVLHVGSTAGAPWWDMWDPKIIERMEQVARDQILPLRDDPRVLGYYSDNEMGWWNATLFKMALEQAPTSGQRRRLIELLRLRYDNDWSKLLRDFQPEGGNSLDELEKGGMLYLRPGSQGIHTYRAFLALVAKRYYSLVAEIIHKYDSRALVLGDRYQSFFYPEVAEAAGPSVDAISGNLNASWNDGSFVRFYPETLHTLSGKPVLISEFYLSARENRSGNKNDQGIFPVVTTQRERAAGFRRTIETLLRIPCVVGADWFQYYDEPTHGRFDGENYNFGLVDIQDRPYESLVRVAKRLDLVALKSRISARPDAAQGVPPAPRDPFAGFKPMLALKNWDRERGFVKPASQNPLADLYVCWNAKGIFLGLWAQDVVEDAFYRDKVIPEIDRAQWIVALSNSSKPIRARIGAGAEPKADEPAVRMTNLSGINLTTRNIAAMEIPAKLFGKERLRAGDTIEFSSTFLTHCGAYSVQWAGKFSLRN